MKIRLLLLWILVFASLIANTVKVELFAPEHCAKGRVPFVLIFTMPKHAHIYAPNDEDSPTVIEWQLPDGVTLKDINWPARKHLSLNGYSFEAYEEKVYVHGSFIVEDTMQLQFVKANIHYVVCDKLCIPEKTQQTLHLINVSQWNEIPQPHEPIKLFPPQMGLMFLFAFIGGLILNLMPCVLPILSLKIISITQHHQPKKLRASGIFFTLGTIVSFWVLAGILQAFRIAGHQVGWGFQLQSPAVVIALIFTFFIFGLNLFGVFEVGTSLSRFSSKRSDDSTLLGSFFHGVLACIVATPCSAPFMGVSVGFALTQNPMASIFIFTGLALGLATPYLLICLNPKSAKFLPQPGPWMVTLKTIFGFAMMATMLWLLHVLADQVSMATFLDVLVTLLVVAIACWVGGHWGGLNRAKYVRLFAAGLALGFITSAYFYVTRPIEVSHEDTWISYDPVVVEKLRKKSPVFIDFTAKWCITCQVNKRLVLNTEKAHKLFKQKKVQLVRADWTTYDASITKALEQYGRGSVPLYVLLYPDGHHKILPEILTFNMLEEALADLK